MGSYADDTRVWMAINNTHEQACLQEELDKIYLWSVYNNQQFNNDKFYCLQWGGRGGGAVGGGRGRWECIFFTWDLSFPKVKISFV